MISVTIFINGMPIVTARAVNVETISRTEGAELCRYVMRDPVKTDLFHVRESGAEVLAIKMLEVIVQEREERRETSEKANSSPPISPEGTPTAG